MKHRAPSPMQESGQLTALLLCAAFLALPSLNAAAMSVPGDRPGSAQLSPPPRDLTSPVLVEAVLGKLSPGHVSLNGRMLPLAAKARIHGPRGLARLQDLKPGMRVRAAVSADQTARVVLEIWIEP